MEELYPDSPYAQSLVRQNIEKSYKNRKSNRPAAIPEPSKGSKSDSGLGDSTEGDRSVEGFFFLVFKSSIKAITSLLNPRWRYTMVSI